MKSQMSSELGCDILQNSMISRVGADTRTPMTYIRGSHHGSPKLWNLNAIVKLTLDPIQSPLST